MIEDVHLQRLPFLLYAFNALFSFKAGWVHVRYQTGVDVRGQARQRRAYVHRQRSHTAAEDRVDGHDADQQHEPQQAHYSSGAALIAG